MVQDGARWCKMVQFSRCHEKQREKLDYLYTYTTTTKKTYAKNEAA